MKIMKTKFCAALRARMPDGLWPAGEVRHPARLVLVALGSIGMAEIGVMLFLALLPNLSAAGRALLDGLMLSAVAVPLLYFLALKPMLNYHRSQIEAERALRSSEQRYSHLFENLSDAAFLADAETGLIVEANRQAEVLLGRPREEIIGMHQTELHPPEKIEEYRTLFGRRAAGDPLCENSCEVINAQRIRVPVAIGASEVAIDGRKYLLGLFRDERERQQTQEALRDTEEKYRELADTLPQIVYEMDLQGNLLFVNRHALQMSGYSEEDFQRGINVFQCLAPEEHDRAQKNIGRLLQGSEAGSNEYIFIRKDGGRLPVEIHSIPIRRNGQSFGLRGFILDVTERKRVETKLQASEAKYRLLAETSPEMIYAISPEGVVQYINAAAAQQFGGSAEAIVGKHLRDIFPPERAEQHLQAILEVARTGQGIQREVETEFPGGRRWLEVRLTPMMDGNRNVIGILGLSNDITQRRAAEAALQKSERLFRALIEHSYDAVTMIAEDGTILFDSPAVTRALGYSPDERVGKKVFDFVISEERDKMVQGFAQFARQPGKVMYYQARFLHKDGSLRWIEGVRTNLLNEADVKAVIVNYRDITQRRQSEEALRESESRLKEAQRISHTGNWEFDAATQRLWWSDELFRIFSLDPDGGPITQARFLEKVHPADRQLLEQEIASGQGHRTDYRIILADGSEKIIHESAKIEHDEEGNLKKIWGTAQDITERRRAEEAVRQSEAKYRSIVETTAEWIWETDLSGKHTYSNQAIEAILGYSPSEILEAHYRDLMHADDCREVERRIPELIASKQGWRNWAIRWRHRDGSFRTLESNAHPIFDAGGELIGYRGADRDITERQWAEAALKSSEEKFAKAFRSSPIAVTVTRLSDGVVIDINRRAETMLGYNCQEALGKSTLELGIWADPDDRARFTEQLIQHGMVRNLEVCLVRKDRRKLIADLSAEIIEVGGERCLLATFLDITERRQVEEALRQSEEKFRALTEQSLTGNCLIQDGKFVYVNPQLAEILNFQPEEMLGMPIQNLVAPGDRELVQGNMRRRLSGEVTALQYTFHALKKGGEEIPMEVYGKAMTYHGRLAIMATLLDITERRQAEAVIRKNLEEKEMLLKEIHHRVKNNLQIISSLLNLQAAHLNGGTAITAFKESQNRIRSMALIHEKLYQSGDMAQVNFGAYVRSLVSHLFHSYRTDVNRVNLEMDIDDVKLGLDSSIPCGLIINELVSNALKHAFPKDRIGNITVSFHQINGHYTLAVQDDGIGIPSDINLEQTESLGLQLLSSLAQQLHGTIELNRNEGTEFKVTF